MSRNKGLDILKLICAYLVVCIHCPFAGIEGQIFNTICRVAVPLFFMMSGYFFNYEKSGVNWKSVRKYLILAVASNAFYFAVICFMNRANLSAHLRGLFYPELIKEILLFNHSPFAGHLWYFNALIYVIIIAGLVMHYPKVRKVLYIVSFVLVLVNIICGEYSIILFGTKIPVLYTRNFVFCGLPFFTIGIWLKEIDILNRIMLRQWIVLLALALVVSVLECVIVDVRAAGRGGEIYFSTLSLAICLMGVFVHIEGTAFEKLAWMGENTTLYIYIFQVFIIYVAEWLCRFEKFAAVYEMIPSVIVFIGTAMLSLGVSLGFIRICCK